MVVKDVISMLGRVKGLNSQSYSFSRRCSFLFLRSRRSRYCNARFAARKWVSTGRQTDWHCLVSTHPSLVTFASGQVRPKSSGWPAQDTVAPARAAPWACPGYLSPGT